MRTYLKIFSLLALVVLHGCADTGKLPPSQKEGQVGPSVLIDAYKMSVGDQVQVTVWKNPELSFSAPIRPDGKIAVPLIGDMMAAGKEPEELAANIRQQLTSYIKNPNVTVMLMNLQGQSFLSRIRVTGEVTQNKSLQYFPGMTVLDAVLDAGSLTLYADGNRTKLHRRTAKGNETYKIRLKDIMEKGDMRTNMTLMPGDVITVPERLF